MAKANLFYNSVERRWELRDRYGAVRAEWRDGSIAVDRNGRIVQGTGTLRDVDIGTLARLQALVVSAQGTIRNLNVPTQINTNTIVAGNIDMSGVGSLDTARIINLRVGAGGTTSLFQKLTGTITGIAAVGTGAVAVATVTNMGSAGIAVGDLIFGIPRAAIGGHTGIVAYIVPTTNVVNVHIANTKPDSAGSFIDVGVDLLQIRNSG